MKRRRFLELLSTVAAGALVLPYVPQKLYFVGGWPAARDQVVPITFPPLPELAKYPLTYGDLTAEQRAYYTRRILERLAPQLPLDSFLRTPNVDMIGKRVQWKLWGGLALPA